jgi:hypothetical protein
LHGLEGDAHLGGLPLGRLTYLRRLRGGVPGQRSRLVGGLLPDRSGFLLGRFANRGPVRLDVVRWWS